MVLSGQHAGVPGYLVTGPAITVNEEGTNLGIISLGNSSAGMYLTGGARGRNEKIILNRRKEEQEGKYRN